MNGLKHGLISVIVLFALTACNIITYEHEETYELDAKGLSTLNINHDEGDVSIIGVKGIDQISVTAIFTAWSDDSIEHAQTFSKKNLSVELFAEEDQAFLKTSVKRGADPEQGFIHLKIEVPNDVFLEYRQNEGQLIIESMRSNLNIQHGTNHLSLIDIQGNIQITDGAGNINLEEVSGEIVVNNNSGATKMTNSIGLTRINAGSGHIEINEHDGDVTIRSGVGNVDIHGVIGNVTILESRDGTITIEDISGTVNQP